VTERSGELRPGGRKASIPRVRGSARRPIVWVTRTARRIVDLIVVWVVVLALGPDDGLVLTGLGLGLTIALVGARESRGLPGPVGDGLLRLLGKLALVGLVAAVLVPLEVEAISRVTGVVVLAVAVGRFLARLVRGVLHRRGRLLEPTLVLGAGPTGQLIARTLQARPSYGLGPVGFVDRIPTHERLPLPLLGSPEELDEVIRRHGIGCVILGFGPTEEADLVEIVRTCDAPDVSFFVLPRFFELGLQSEGSSSDVRGFPLVPLRLAPRPLHAKRAFDVVVGGLLLLLTLPLMGLGVLAVRLAGPGPIIFRQERIGRNGETFEMLKLRSLHPGRDDGTWGLDEDRVTWAGRILRPTHLDELPQLINVLRGDMSIVGPRPERPMFVQEFGQQFPRYLDRHRVPVGLTGLAQVNGLWGESSIEERARVDNRYIESWSLRQDLAILLRTVPTLLGQRDRESTAEVVVQDTVRPC
jgi:exopolysaccharide biosynthesis polyprenyl glycosylphosphotransferase